MFVRARRTTPLRHAHRGGTARVQQLVGEVLPRAELGDAALLEEGEQLDVRPREARVQLRRGRALQRRTRALERLPSRSPPGPRAERRGAAPRAAGRVMPRWGGAPSEPAHGGVGSLPSRRLALETRTLEEAAHLCRRLRRLPDARPRSETLTVTTTEEGRMQSWCRRGGEVATRRAAGRSWRCGWVAAMQKGAGGSDAVGSDAVGSHEVGSL